LALPGSIDAAASTQGSRPETGGGASSCPSIGGKVMTTRTLNKADWQPYFDRMGSLLEGKLTSVEIMSTQLGDQWAVRRLPLSGIAYDPKDDLIELDLRGVDHLMHHPLAVTVEEQAGGIASMEIVTEDGVREIMTFHDPLMLTAETIGDDADSTHRLILASRVIDTSVLSPSGERIGKIDDLSVNRFTGEVIYAVVSFGGFLGMGEKFHPLPWSLLDYNTAWRGFVVPLDRETLEAAPTFDREELVELGGTRHLSYGERIFGYYGRYGALPYW